jgi:hypothetical protein
MTWLSWVLVAGGPVILAGLVLLAVLLARLAGTVRRVRGQLRSRQLMVAPRLAVLREQRADVRSGLARLRRVRDQRPMVSAGSMTRRGDSEVRSGKPGNA